MGGVGAGGGGSRGGFQSVVEVLQAIATARGQPAVLSPAELAAYGRALGVAMIGLVGGLAIAWFVGISGRREAR